MTQRFGQISTLGGIFSPIFRMHGHILIKLFFTITHYQVHMTLGSKVEVTDNIFQKCPLPTEAYLIDVSPSKTIWFLTVSP